MRRMQNAACGPRSCHSGARRRRESGIQTLARYSGSRVLRCAQPRDDTGENCGGAIQPISRAGVIAEARAWLGTPYLHQASAKGRGTDCLGLVRGVWRALYGGEPETPPPYTPDWSERRFAAGEEPLIEAARRHLAEIPPAERQPGDVLVFRVVAGGPAKHCGIMSAPDRFIHAYAGRSVVEGWLNRWWTERLAGVFAFRSVNDSRRAPTIRSNK